MEGERVHPDHGLTEEDIGGLVEQADRLEKEAREEEGWKEPNYPYWAALLIEGTWALFCRRYPQGGAPGGPTHKGG